MNKQREGELEAPPCVLVGRVLLSRLGADQANLSRILRQAAGAWRDARRRILLWAVVGPEADLASEEAQATFVRATATLVNYCESVTLIVLGTDVQQTLVRSSLRGLTMTSLAGKAMRVRVVEDFGAAAKAAGDSTLRAAELEGAAQAAGIMAATKRASGAGAPT